jgi:hypothetical protein
VELVVGSEQRSASQHIEAFIFGLLALNMRVYPTNLSL